MGEERKGRRGEISLRYENWRKNWNWEKNYGEIEDKINKRKCGFENEWGDWGRKEDKISNGERREGWRGMEYKKVWRRNEGEKKGWREGKDLGREWFWIKGKYDGGIEKEVWYGVVDKRKSGWVNKKDGGGGILRKGWNEWR